MSLYPLIKDQKIIIDDHKRGAGEIKDWDNNENDVHLDKTLKRKVHGKLQTLRIKIPLNSERESLVWYQPCWSLSIRWKILRMDYRRRCDRI